MDILGFQIAQLSGYLLGIAGICIVAKIIWGIVTKFAPQQNHPNV